MLEPEHRAQRIGRITSSIIPAVVGCDRYTTARQAKQAILGLDTFEGNSATERGEVLEEPLLKWAAKKLGYVLKMVGFKKLGDIFGDSVDGIFCNEDGTIAALAEVKTAAGHAAKEWGEDGTDQVPDKVRIQCLWHMLHYPEADRCYVPFAGDYGFDLRIYHVDWDDSAIEFLQAKARAFHKKYIENDETPPIEAGDEEDIKKAFPVSDDSILENDRHIDDLVWEMKNIELEMAGGKALEEKLKSIKATLREMLGIHGGAVGEGYKVSYRQRKDSAKVNWKGVAASSGYSDSDIANNTTIVPGGRTLRVTIK